MSHFHQTTGREIEKLKGEEKVGSEVGNVITIRTIWLLCTTAYSTLFLQLYGRTEKYIKSTSAPVIHTGANKRMSG